MRFITILLSLLLLVGCAAPEIEIPEVQEKDEAYWNELGLYESIPIQDEDGGYSFENYKKDIFNIDDFIRLNSYPYEVEVTFCDVYFEYDGGETRTTSFRSYKELMDQKPHIPSFIVRTAENIFYDVFNDTDNKLKYPIDRDKFDWLLISSLPELTYMTNMGNFGFRYKEWVGIKDSLENFYWRDVELIFSLRGEGKILLHSVTPFSEFEAVSAEKILKEVKP